jgi:hypothetical protein
MLSQNAMSDRVEGATGNSVVGATRVSTLIRTRIYGIFAFTGLQKRPDTMDHLACGPSCECEEQRPIGSKLTGRNLLGNSAGEGGRLTCSGPGQDSQKAGF